jgi:methylmalonyl-CoA decarboxylase subunit alpha
VVAEFRRRRDEVRSGMGGAAKVEAMRAAGTRTAREHIQKFLDPGSFDEVGTFSFSETPADRATTPGDGKISGHGTVDDRPVSVVADDITVRRASSSPVGSRRIDRVYAHAIRNGNPLVYFGATGGGRLPETLSAEGLARAVSLTPLNVRGRQVPLATAIVGHSFGGSSLVSALSDFVVQVRGTCLAITSPRVIEVATGSRIGMEELGGVDVHSRVTGQIDATAESDDEAYTSIRRFLDFLPSNALSMPRRRVPLQPPAADPDIHRLIPAARRRGYDMRRVLRRLVDGGDLLELKPEYGRSLITGLARINGYSVGVVASQPMHDGGVLTPQACAKAVRLICLCEAFNLPLVFLQDVPGFMVGAEVEHAGLLHKAMMLNQAVLLATTPKLTVIVRKAYGLALASLAGPNMGGEYVFAWPGAELGLMDPEVAVKERARHIAEDVTPYPAAGIMKIDEIIDPADTGPTLGRALHRLAGRRVEPLTKRPLAGWPTSW